MTRHLKLRRVVEGKDEKPDVYEFYFQIVVLQYDGVTQYISTITSSLRNCSRSVSIREDPAPDRFDEDGDENDGDDQNDDDRYYDRDDEKFLREAVATAVLLVELVKNLKLRAASGDQKKSRREEEEN